MLSVTKQPNSDESWKKGVPLEVEARVGDWTVLAKPMKVDKDPHPR